MSLIEAFGFLIYITPQLLAPQGCYCASASITPRLKSKLSSIPPKLNSLPSFAPLDSIEVNDSSYRTTNKYPQQMTSSYLETQVGTSTSLNYHSSTGDSGIARKRCLEQPINLYKKCFAKAIVKSPHLAVRFAGRSLRASQACHRLVLHQLEICQKNLSKQPNGQ